MTRWPNQAILYSLIKLPEHFHKRMNDMHFILPELILRNDFADFLNGPSDKHSSGEIQQKANIYF